MTVTLTGPLVPATPSFPCRGALAALPGILVPKPPLSCLCSGSWLLVLMGWVLFTNGRLWLRPRAVSRPQSLTASLVSVSVGSTLVFGGQPVLDPLGGARSLVHRCPHEHSSRAGTLHPPAVALSLAATPVPLPHVPVLRSLCGPSCLAGCISFTWEIWDGQPALGAALGPAAAGPTRPSRHRQDPQRHGAAAPLPAQVLILHAFPLASHRGGLLSPRASVFALIWISVCVAEAVTLVGSLLPLGSVSSQRWASGVCPHSAPRAWWLLVAGGSRAAQLWNVLYVHGDSVLWFVPERIIPI